MEYRTTTRFRCHDADDSCRLCTFERVYDVGQSSWVTTQHSLRLLFRFFPRRVHALPSTSEKDRRTETRRETNARYTRRRHLQKVAEKQERKPRAAFCTIVKSTDGRREIDNARRRSHQLTYTYTEREVILRVHEALSRFIQRLARLRGTGYEGHMSLSTQSRTHRDLQRQLPSAICIGLAGDGGYIYPLNRAFYGFSTSREYLASFHRKWLH